jgi:tetratricopeptide (TPR) repeat protein
LHGRWIDRPAPKYRRRGEVPEPASLARSALRRVGRAEPAEPAPARTPRARRPTPARRRRAGATEALEELSKLAGRNAKRAQDQLQKAAESFRAGRERDAMRALRPLRDAYPDAAAVRELMGLCHYRIGQYPAASKELEAFADLSDSVEQHPVLMDCYRAQRKYGKVEALWEELAQASPSGALVTEGRIVLAGSLADRGRVRDAIALLERKGAEVKRVGEHHLRLWYALADLYERSGELPRARELFGRVRKNDAAFADVAERLAALG